MKLNVCRMPWFILAVVFILTYAAIQSAFGFDLAKDIVDQTYWTLGSSIQAGTAMALRSDDATNVKAGQFLGSALASVANYRFLNLSAGGIFIPQSNGTLKALDSAKIGLNLAYILKDFVNAPPLLLTNLVIGPSVSTSLVTTPHTVIPSIDVNYQFSGTGK